MKNKSYYLIRFAALMLLFMAVIGGYFWYKHSKAEYDLYVNQPQQAAVVSATKATSRMWQSHINAVGSTRAYQGVNVSSETAGIINIINFKSGQNVSKDDILVTLRNHDLAADIAVNNSIKANALLNYERSKALFAKRVSTKADLDDKNYALKEAIANLAKSKALYAKTIIKAPFSGRLGIRQVDVGQYIQQGSTVVTLQQISPLLIDFSIPEKYSHEITVGTTINLECAVCSNKKISGQVRAVNPKINTTNRMLSVLASIENKDELLLPGMFVNVDIAVGKQEKMITVPQTAISYDPYGDSVFTIVDGKAEQQYVRIGERHDDEANIVSGIKEGDMIVTTGQQKLTEGMPVKIGKS